MAELSGSDGLRTSLQPLRDGLQSLSEFDRKLLAHIVELAYREPRHERAAGVAYLPELYETTGIDVDDSYTMFAELARTGLIEMEEEYPFQDIKVRSELFEPLVRYCASEKIALRDILVDQRFDLLA